MSIFTHWKVQAMVAFLILALVISVLVAVFSKVGEQTFGGGLVSVDRFGVDAIGSAASGTILTQVYVSSTRVKVLGLDKVVVAGSYLPRSFAPKLFLVVERSVDNGQTYYPYTVTSEGISTVGVNVNGFTTSSLGIPFQIPAINSTASSTSGTPMLFSFQLDYPFTADYMRVAVKEQTTSTGGLVNVQIMGTN